VVLAQVRGLILPVVLVIRLAQVHHKAIMVVQSSLVALLAVVVVEVQVRLVLLVLLLEMVTEVLELPQAYRVAQ
jgi:hypothetical protein